MSLKLRQQAIVTAYAVVPIGRYTQEVKHARKVLGRSLSKLVDPGVPKDSAPSAKLLYILGQADLGIRIELPDFQHVFDIEYPGGGSYASTVNWVYSVPYDIDTSRNGGSAADAFQFALHIRLQRDVYAYKEAERRIIDAIVDLPHAKSFVQGIEIGLGWSDLIACGFFKADSYLDFMEFLVSVHGLHFLIGRTRLPVLNRMLTIIGYDPQEPPTADPPRHMTFVRSVPGMYVDLQARLSKLGGEAYILDGKADFAVFGSDVKPGFLKTQKDLTDTAEAYESLRRIETHLLFMPANELVKYAQRTTTVAGTEQRRLHKACTCAAAHASAHGDIESDMSVVRKQPNGMPRHHDHAVQNALFLLGATMRDESVCCDVRFAAEACYDGLRALLRGLKEAASKFKLRRTESPPPGRDASEDDWDASYRRHYEALVGFHKRIDDWHRLVEMTLRQRTVGSFEEILGQSDRAVVYSGGFQKFLYLADCLVNDFARMVDEEPPKFAAIYDAVKTPLSRQGVGLIRIPTRKIFRLPLAVPDLWHEVGVYFFYVRFAKMIERLLRDGKSYTFIENLHDHYGDLLVYLYGFGADLERFLASLASGWVDAYGATNAGVRKYAMTQLIARAYLVAEFDDLRDLVAKRRRFKSPFDVVRRVITRLLNYFTESFGQGPYEQLKVPAPFWDLLWNNVTHPDFAWVRQLYVDVAEVRPAARTARITPFENGEIRAFKQGDNLNEYFGEMAFSIQAPNRSGDIEPFGMMAALGKSTSIEYRRRQASGQLATGSR